MTFLGLLGMTLVKHVFKSDIEGKADFVLTIVDYVSRIDFLDFE